MVEREGVAVILVGDELLKGERSDAHLRYVGEQVRQRGALITAASVVPDDVGAIADAVRTNIRSARVVLLTGGLGPTKDDITREGVAEGIARELTFDDDAWEKIVAFFASVGRKASEANRRQAEFPEGATVIENNYGTAPGFSVDVDGTTVFVLPGPPTELQKMFVASVAPRLDEIFGGKPVYVETFRTIGIGESQLMEQLGDQLWQQEAFKVSSLPWKSGVDIILTARRSADQETARAEADAFDQALRGAIGSKYFERGIRSLPEVVGATLSERGETLAIAESLTGGWIAKLLTDAPGSSAYFLADAVTYSDESKSSLLGVREETLAEHGAVSEEVAIEMAHGARNRSGATWGVSTTGIAGPSGARPGKPIGLTYLAVAWDGGSQSKRVTYKGSRDDVRFRATNGALWMLLDRMLRS